MRVLFVGDAISGRLILEEIKKVGVLVALAIDANSTLDLALKLLLLGYIK